MKEKEFQKNWTRSIRRHLIDTLKTKDFVYHKISDMSMDRKPFDCFLVFDYLFYWMELKIHKKHTAFAFDKVETHQLDALNRTCMAGWIGLLIINVNYWRKVWQNFVCLFDIRSWLRIIDKSTKKSIKIDDMIQQADFVLWKSKWLWEMDWLIKRN